MRGWKSILVGVAIGVTVSAAVYAQQKGSGKALTQEDYAEIQRLYARYNWALDSHAEGGMALAKLFTSDAEWINGTTKYVGHERLAKFGAGSTPAVPGPPRHIATNIIITPSPEGARGSAYLLYIAPTPADGKPSMVVTGTYDDTFVKTAQGWRFKRREFGSDKLMLPEGVPFLSAN